MVEWHYKSKRKPSGGILKSINRADKKLTSRGGIFSSTTIVTDPKKVVIKTIRMQGGKTRQKTKKVLFANVSDGKKIVKAKILSVLENSANRLYTRRNIISKGAFLSILIGKEEKTAKVTSRPGQSGNVNAIFASSPEKKEKKKAVKKEEISKKKEPKQASIEEENAKKEQKSDSSSEKTQEK